MWDITGQDRAVSLLRLALERDALSHAYLLMGPAHVGKMTLAVTLAQALNCESDDKPCGVCSTCQRIVAGTHADVQIVELGNGNGSLETESQVKIKVEQIKQILHSANLSPFEGNYRVFIINGVEFMSTEAANRLLKNLEEPASNVVFILLTENESLVLTTIISRCQKIELVPLPAGEIENALVNQWGVEAEKAAKISGLSSGCLGWAVMASNDDTILEQRTEWLTGMMDVINTGYEQRFAYVAKLTERSGKTRAALLEGIDLWLNWWRDLMLVKADCRDAVISRDYLPVFESMIDDYSLVQIRTFIDTIRLAGEQIKLNANPQLVLETLMFSIPEIGKKVTATA